MILIINTCLEKQTELILVDKSNKFKIKKIQGSFNQSEKLLPAINSLIKNRNQLKGVGVVVGPGGFTTVRVGVAIANALAYTLKIPVVGLRKNQFNNNDDLIVKILQLCKTAKPGQFVLPYYDREPNIGFN